MRSRPDAKLGHLDLHTVLGSSVGDQFEAKIRFAIKISEQEAKTGTYHPRECCKVLQDLAWHPGSKPTFPVGTSPNTLTGAYKQMTRMPIFATN
jgi:hypothetical protein